MNERAYVRVNSAADGGYVYRVVEPKPGESLRWALRAALSQAKAEGYEASWVPNESVEQPRSVQSLRWRVGRQA